MQRFTRSCDQLLAEHIALNLRMASVACKTEVVGGLSVARLADMERNPSDQSPWPEVKARLERLNS